MADIEKATRNAATAKVALNVGKKMLGGGKTMLLILLGGLGTISPIIILGLGIVLILGIATLAKGGFGNNPLTASGIGSGGGALTYPSGANPTDIGTCLDNYLKKNSPNSPLVGKGIAFAQAGQKYNVNPAFLLAMGGSESTFATNWGSITADSFNYASLTCGCTQKSPCFKKPGSTNPRTWEKYQSWDDAITRHAQYIRTKYLDKNIITIAGIGAIYCGADCTSWNKDTNNYFNKITAACPILSTGSNVVPNGSFKQYPNKWTNDTEKVKVGGMTIKGVVLHYTEGNDVAGAVSAMTSRRTYVHLIIDKNGTVNQLLPLNTKVTSGSGDGNSFAVGIEIVGMNEQELLNNTAQFNAVVGAVKWIIQNYNVPNVRGNTQNLQSKQGIFGHYQTQGPWNGQQPGCNSPQKIDPGRNYMKKVWDALGSTGQGC